MLLEILHFPDSRLRTQAQPVQKIDNRIRQIVANMFETMYNAPAIGLAATQVNIHQQIIVIDVTEEKNQPYCFINPKIIHSEGNASREEGCLSVPQIFEHVKRAETVTVAALNEKGEDFTLTADELLAICIQHEIDHLKGKLFIDYLSTLKRERIRKKLQKQKREAMVNDE
jgi:peptide deformylase